MLKRLKLVPFGADPFWVLKLLTQRESSVNSGEAENIAAESSVENTVHKVDIPITLSKEIKDQTLIREGKEALTKTDEIKLKLQGQDIRQNIDVELQAKIKDSVEVDESESQLLPGIVRQLLGDKESRAEHESKNSKLHALANAVNNGVNQGTLNEGKLENISEMLALEEGELTVDMDAEALFSKLAERLNLDKNFSEAQFQQKLTIDKGLQFSDFVDQLASKTNAESLDKLSAMSSLNTTARTTTAPVIPQQLTLQTQVNNSEWGADFSKRIQFLIKNNMQHAELRLDPPDLGKIHVKINLSQDQASISFASAHSNVRDAIEQAMPRLRELLNESGLQLGDTEVASQFQQQNENQTERDSNGTSANSSAEFGDGEELEFSDIPHQAMEYSVDGMIDYFA